MKYAQTFLPIKNTDKKLYLKFNGKNVLVGWENIQICGMNKYSTSSIHVHWFLCIKNKRHALVSLSKRQKGINLFLNEPFEEKFKWVERALNILFFSDGDFLCKSLWKK